MTEKISLKQFRNEGCLSFILIDTSSKEAIVIDPHAGLIEDYADYIASEALKPIIALDTHIHADHFSATHFFRSKYNSNIGMARSTSSLRPNKKLVHGDKVNIGQLELQVLETPGHTPDSLSFVGHGMAFTGDTLFIGSSGRTDFPGADAEKQWESIHKTLGELQPSTLIMPGHDYSGFIFSTLRVEKEKNPHWMPTSKDKFIALKKSEIVATSPEQIRKCVYYNREAQPADVAQADGCATACGAPVRDSGTFSNIDVSTYQKILLKNGGEEIFIDVREPDEFQLGHIEGTTNIPLSQLPLALDKIPKGSKIYFSCLGGGRSSSAAKTFDYLGYKNVVNIAGGFREWMAQKLPVTK